MMFNDLNSFFAICRLKNKITLNTLKAKANSGKAFGLIIFAICCIWAVSDFSSEATSKLLFMPYGTDIIKLLFSFIVLCLCFITFTGDISLGHTFETGQLSKDFIFLKSMPIKPFTLIASKLYERFISDYFGFMVMFSFFIGISCRNGINFWGICVSTVLYVQLSLFIGLLINVLMLVLSHFFKKTTTENIFSAIGYISAFSILIPFLFFNSQPQQTLNKIAEIIKSCGDIPDILFAPFVWVAECLIQSKFCFEFVKFSLFWLVLMAIGCYAYSLAMKHNWFNLIVTNKVYTKVAYKSGWFKGIIGKEFKLLKSDFNMLFNAICMPITVILVEIYLMKNTFSFTSINSIRYMIFGSIIYFCMFGPINCVGGEGRSISLLEAMPISAEKFILNKFLVWFLLAEFIFIPTSFLAVYLLRFPIVINIKITLSVFVFTAICVLGAVLLSAISANYNAKSFPQRSSIIAKPAVMAMLFVAIFINSFSKLDILSLVGFLSLILLTWKKACLCLKHRLDDEVLELKVRKINYCLFLFSYFSAVVTMQQIFEALIPGVNTSHWSYSFPLIVVAPLTIMYFFSDKIVRKKI